MLEFGSPRLFGPGSERTKKPTIFPNGFINVTPLVKASSSLKKMPESRNSNAELTFIQGFSSQS
jgi:hypothetical protein